MGKKELVEALAAKMEASKKDAAKWVEGFVQCIQDAVCETGTLQLVGFGTFKMKERKPRMGRNPKTGKKLKIPATKTVGFKPGTKFKSAL